MLPKVIARAGLYVSNLLALTYIFLIISNFCSFFVGSISPPIADVEITIVDADNEANIILEGIKTGADGTYRAGPLPDDRAYKTVR